MESYDLRRPKIVLHGTEIFNSSFLVFSFEGKNQSQLKI